MQYSAVDFDVPLQRMSLQHFHLRAGIERVNRRSNGGHMGRKGFSLIELMFVFVLAGVIMAIGFPRLRNSVEQQNIRSAKALLGTLAATARGSAVQRGCNATLNMTVDSIWVTACDLTPPFAPVQIGTKKLVGDEFNVSLAPV